MQPMDFLLKKAAWNYKYSFEETGIDLRSTPLCVCLRPYRAFGTALASWVNAERGYCPHR
jgi:hypothetical protein